MVPRAERPLAIMPAERPAQARTLRVLAREHVTLCASPRRLVGVYVFSNIDMILSIGLQLLIE